MRKILVAAVTVAAFGAVACSDVDSPTAVHSGSEGVQYESSVKQAGNDQYNGPTWVIATFDLAVGGWEVEPGVNQHNQGECRDESGVVNSNSLLNTVWYNPAGEWTNAKHCEGIEGEASETLQCTASGSGIAATYAAKANTPGAGNENLNFLTNEEGDDVEDLFVHYKDNGEHTVAKGAVEFAYSCESGVTGVGTIDLGLWNVAGNVFVERDQYSRQLEIDGQTFVTDLGEGELESLYWVFRSRVGDD